MQMTSNKVITESVLAADTVCIDMGVALTQVQDFALGLAEPYEVHMGPLLKPVKVCLDLDFMRGSYHLCCSPTQY